MEIENATAAQGASTTETASTEVQASQGAGGASDTTSQTAAGKTPEAGNQPPATGGNENPGATGDSAATWKPSFKFKVKDKELEFDDSLKGLIKSKDLETKIRELHEKAYGIDEVKGSRDKLQTELSQSKQQFQQVEAGLQRLGTFVERKDYGSFFQALKIPKQDIINYAIQELKYAELPPEQKAAIDQQRQQQQALWQAEQQTQTLQQQLSSVTVAQTHFEIDQAIAAPQVQAIAQAYDAKVGRPGAFKQQVIQRGQYYENVHQVSPPASKLVEELLSFVGVQAPAQPGTGLPSQGTQAASQVVQQQKEKPVIPAFQGASSTKSATKKVLTSVEDLRKIRQERIQQQQG